MKVKEAIEFLDDIFSRCKLKKCNLQNLNKIIYLLEQGEKYRKMWEELDDFIGYSDYDILQKMKELKQKYFPKEEKNEK